MDTLSFASVIRHLSTIKKPVVREVWGKKFILLPKVFDPTLPDALLLAQAIQRLDFKVGRALDMGTGCGGQTVFLSEHARSIVATDVSSVALENARLNFELHGLQENVRLVKSDLFSNVEDVFDLIVFNPPFFSRRVRNVTERAVTDYRHRLLHRFLRETGTHLEKNGRILLVLPVHLVKGVTPVLEKIDFRLRVLNRTGDFQVIELKR